MCIRDRQSPGPILCGHIAVAPLFPKLRGQFAEFLNYPSPVGLRILFLSTCVGLRYGHLRYSQDFSRPSPRILPYSNFSPLRPGQPTPGLCSFWVSSCLNLSVATEFLPYVHRLRPVSYTHLDVYKRQAKYAASSISSLVTVVLP